MTQLLAAHRNRSAHKICLSHFGHKKMTFSLILSYFLIAVISLVAADSHVDDRYLQEDQIQGIDTTDAAVTLKIQFGIDTEDVSIVAKTEVAITETPVVRYDMPFDSFPESTYQDQTLVVTIPVERGVLHRLEIRQRDDAQGIIQYELYEGSSTDPSMLFFRDSFVGAFEGNYFIVEEEPTSSPTPAPASTATPTGGFGCFPGDAFVQEKSKGMVQMKSLELGDQVLVSRGRFETIYSFGHKDAEISMDFIRLRTSTLDLETTKEHMLFVADGRVIPASMVKVGDKLVLANNQAEVVLSTSATIRKGAFAPFTPSGSIVVNGVKASTFIALQETEHLTISGVSTHLSYHRLAHIFESPHRLWCSINSCDSETYIEGISTWVYHPHKVARWLVTGLDRMTTVTMTIYSSPVLDFVGASGWIYSLGCIGFSFLLYLMSAQNGAGKGVCFRFAKHSQKKALQGRGR